MTTFIKALLVLTILSTHLLRAEDPVVLGIQSAINSLKSVPASTASEASDAAIKILSPYLRPSQSGFYCRSGNSWVEVRGLRIKSTSLGTISQADRANGISDSIIVHLAADMHRRQKSDKTWSAWVNGNYGFLPRNIRVQKRNRQWSGEATQLRLLQPCNDQAITIPTATASSTTVKAPISSGIHPSAPSKSKLPSQPTPTPDQTSAAGTTPSNTTPKLGLKAIGNGILNAIPKFGILLLALLAITVLTNKYGRKSRKPRSQPPAPPRQSAAPPPLPSESYRNPLDLITRRETLMTPAEQKFFAALAPLVSPACLISSKVRLADLFEVREAPGQQAAFNKISSKHIDFVLTEPGTSRILCGIELDDRSHQRPDRIERDRFVDELFATKRLPLLRVPCASSYDADALHQSLATLLDRPLAA